VALFFLVMFAGLFVGFVALVFSLLTLLLGKVWTAFEVSGPDDWSFIDFYKRYLIIAAVFTLTTPCSLLLGIGALAFAYKFVFDAGWVQAAVMGTVGGFIAVVLWVILMAVVLTPLGLVGTPVGGPS